VIAAVTDNPRRSRPDYIGRYRVVDRIGRGAMGVVYSAHDDLMDRDVAVKVMMTDLEGEPDIRARFLREAQVSATLTHRNIVTVFDIGEDNGRLFIVMELLRGQTLAECLKQRTLTIEEKVDLTIEVCEGLAVASAAGVCHRDVKPGNLFLQADGGVKILDFGIARLATSSMTASGFIVGTPDYMSPEQARGVGVDERSDIFSLAAVLYLMLAGRKPFEAPDLPAVLHKVVSEEPPPVDPATAPAALMRIVFKALAKDPAQRFQKFAEFSAELARWRRRYEVETRAQADGVARGLEALQDLAAEERRAAHALGISPESQPDGWLAEIGADYPDLLTHGAGALRSGQRYRKDVDIIAGRIAAVKTAWEPRIASLRGAAADLTTATSHLEAGDARAALAGFERVQRRVPSAPIEALAERARQLVAEQQAREGKLRSLLAEANDALNSGRLDAAHTLAIHATEVDAQSADAHQLLKRVQHELAAAELEKRRKCARCLERARRALQFEQLDEAEQQLQLAVDTGAAHADIALVRAAIAEARSARDAADQLTQEIARELASARAEFREGERAAALARLEALSSRHPSSAAARAELLRLRAEDERLIAAKRAADDAETLAEQAAAALGRGDAKGAMQLADQALALVPSHEMALRTSAVAHAQVREVSEREARQERARQLVESARALLAAGRFDAAIGEARKASELDPLGNDAPGLIAEAFQRQAEASAREANAREAARRNAELRQLVDSAAKALRAGEFAGARVLAEQALALDPDSTEPRDLIAKIATKAALAAKTFEDETVELPKAEADPEATAVLAPVSEGWRRQWTFAMRVVKGFWSAVVARARQRLNRRATKSVKSGAAAGADPGRKEA
jgi:serine/threonine-protein kinase